MASKPRFTPTEIPPKELRAFLKEAGAPTMKEIKEHFSTDSRSARKALGRLLYSDKINLIVMGGANGSTFWFEWPKNQAGKPNPRKIRKEASDRRAKLEAKRERIRKKLVTRDESMEVDFERDD